MIKKMMSSIRDLNLALIDERTDEVYYIDNVSSIDSEDIDVEKPRENVGKISDETTISFDVDIPPGFLDELLITKNKDDSWCYLIPTVTVQKRKHKKRRINKKWAKRYGYKEVIIPGFENQKFSINKIDNLNMVLTSIN